MNVFDAISARRSIRRYEDRPIEPQVLRRVLEAARLAPSARNNQNLVYLVVTDKGLRRQLVDAAKGQTFVGQAAAVVVACGTDPDYIMSCGQPAYVIDAAIALDHLSLAAVDEGLGTCWIGAFYEDRVKQVLDIPDEVRLVQMMTLGYPGEAPEPRSRKAWDEVVRTDRW